MKSIAFIVSTILSSVSIAQAQNCHQPGAVKSDRDCLNNYARTVLSSDQPEGIRDIYQEELRDKIENAGLEVMPEKSLHQLVRGIEIPRVRSENDSHRSACFDFAKDPKKAKQVEQQIREAAFFLKTFHTRSLGRPSSYLFNIQKIEVCSGGKRTTEFAGNVLRINLGEKLITAQELMDSWTDGTIVFGPDQGKTAKVTDLINNPTSALKQIPREMWPLLNPIGDIRYSLRIGLAKKLEEMKNKDLPEILADLNLPETPCTKEKSQAIMSRFGQKLNNDGFLGELQEQATLEFNTSKYNVSMVDRRKYGVVIGATNNKQVVVDADLGSLFRGSVYDFSSELPRDPKDVLFLSEKEIGVLLGFDGIDQVVVTARTPKNLLKILQRVSMKEALKGSCRYGASTTSSQSETGTW